MSKPPTPPAVYHHHPSHLPPCIPVQCFADGILWEEPLNGSRAPARQAERRSSRKAGRADIRQVGKRARSPKTKCANSPTGPSNVIGRYEKKYKHDGKLFPRYPPAPP